MLFQAAYAGHSKVVGILLDCGAAIDELNDVSRRMCHLCMCDYVVLVVLFLLTIHLVIVVNVFVSPISIWFFFL